MKDRLYNIRHQWQVYRADLHLDKHLFTHLDKHLIAALVIAPFIWISLAFLTYCTDILALPIPDFSMRLLYFSVFLYPMLEELTFRGLVQGYFLKVIPITLKYALIQKQYSLPSAANLLTSVIFTFCHWYIVSPTLTSLLVFFPSLIFGHFRERFDSVIPAIFLHIFYNGGFMLTLLLLNRHNIH